MSFTLYTPINALCFLSELDRIELSVPGAQSVEVSIFKGGATIFSNSYIPNEDERVIIYDLDKVLEPYLNFDNLRSNQFSLAVGSDTRQFIVIPCSAAINEAAADFLPDFFMTPMMTQRDTCIGRYETVTAFVISGTNYSVLASYYNGSELKTRQFSDSTTGDCAPIDVSPARFVDDNLGELVSYVVQCGKRKARYRVLRTMPEADPAIIFRNCFGCWETIYLTGTKTRQPKYTRSSAIIDGCFKVYDIAEEMLWEAYTGSLRPGMVAVANDLARSKSVFLLDRKGNIGDEIVITDCDIKTGNNDDEIPDLKFTFRRANNRSALIETIRPPRIFDKYFNETFE